MTKILLRRKGKIGIVGSEFECEIELIPEGKRFRIKSERFPLYEGKSKYENGIHYPDGEGCLHIHYSDSFQVKACGNWTYGGFLSRGTLYTNDNNYYTGKLKLLKPDGKGTLYNKDGQKRIEGKWRDGFPFQGTEFNKDGSVKYEGFFYRGKYNGMGILYQKNGVKDGLFQNGAFKISKEDLLKQRKGQQTIKKYLSQNRQEYLNQITTQEIKDYLKKYAKVQVDGTKQKLIQSLKKFKQELNKQQTTTDQKLDPVTFQTIQTPVIGNDGVIYDKSTLQSILGNYLSYQYNDDHKLVPIYRILAGGVPVSKYYTLQKLQKDTSIPKRQQFIQKLEKFAQL